MPKLTKAEKLLRKIKGVLARESFRKQNKRQSIQYFANLDSRRHRGVVHVTKHWLEGKKTYGTIVYFHVKENLKDSGIALRLNFMPGPGEQL